MPDQISAEQSCAARVLAFGEHAIQIVLLSLASWRFTSRFEQPKPPRTWCLRNMNINVGWVTNGQMKMTNQTPKYKVLFNLDMKFGRGLWQKSGKNMTDSDFHRRHLLRCYPVIGCTYGHQCRGSMNSCTESHW